MVGALTFKTIMLKGTAHTVTTLMVRKTKTPWNTKIWDKLSSVDRGLWLLCTHRALCAEPKLPMNGTPWKGSSRGLAQKTKIFIIETPVESPGSKVLDGGSVLHKPGTITWKAASINPGKHMESLYPTIERHNFLRFSNRLESQRG